MSDSMQNDAMERLKQMYSKAQPTQKAVTTHQGQKKPEEKPQEEQRKKEVHRKNSDNIFDVFLKDKEKSLILLLVVLLISEKADTPLILSLLYLVL